MITDSKPRSRFNLGYRLARAKARMNGSYLERCGGAGMAGTEGGCCPAVFHRKSSVSVFWRPSSIDGATSAWPGYFADRPSMGYQGGRRTPLEGSWSDEIAAMNIVIRDETAADHEVIVDLTERAFASMPFSEGDEQHLIGALRQADALAISMVAIRNEEVVGHVAFSSAKSDEPNSNWFALGPVAVEPELQGQRIGTALIEAGILRLKKMGASGCILTGDPNYYSRFGFRQFPKLCPPGERAEYFMMLPLKSNTPATVVQFHPLFQANADKYVG